MKSRRVTITLEAETDAPLSVLRKAMSYNKVPPLHYYFKILQAQANVIAEKKDTTRRKR